MICEPVDLVQVLVVEDVRPEDRHRQPDPKGRQKLDEQKAPVAEDQPEAVEEEDEGADRKRQRAEEDVRLAQPHDRLLDLGLVRGPRWRGRTRRSGRRMAQAIHACIMPARRHLRRPAFRRASLTTTFWTMVARPPVSPAIALLIIVAATAIAIASMLLVRRRAPEGSVFEDGDRAAGASGSWRPASRSCSASSSSSRSRATTRAGAEAEALAVTQQYETAQFMPVEVRARLSGELVCYARSVVYEEWPTRGRRAMRSTRGPPLCSGP